MLKSEIFVILAVTKTHEKYCIAGMDSYGNWVRPLPVGAEKFWSSVFYQNGEPILVGDVWKISDYKHEYETSSPGHTEDIRLLSHPEFIEHLSNEKLLQFVEKHQEDITALTDTMNADSRSLCLIAVDEFSNSMEKNSYDGSVKPRISFSFEGKEYSNTSRYTNGYPITDLKWRAYTIKNTPIPTEMNHIFICVGLARTEPRKNILKEYPMIISVITDPKVPILSTYPN